MFNRPVFIGNGTEDSAGLCFHVYMCGRGLASAEHVKVNGVPTFTEVTPSMLMFLGESVRTEKQKFRRASHSVQYNKILMHVLVRIYYCNLFM